MKKIPVQRTLDAYFVTHASTSLVPQRTVAPAAAQHAQHCQTRLYTTHGKKPRSPSPPQKVAKRKTSPARMSRSSSRSPKRAISVSSTSTETASWGSRSSTSPPPAPGVGGDQGPCPTPTSSGPSAGVRPASVTAPIPVPKKLLHPYRELMVPKPTAQQRARDDQLRYGERSVILPWSDRNVYRREEEPAGGGGGGGGNNTEKAWPQILAMLQHDRSQNAAQLTGLLQALLLHHTLAAASRNTFVALTATINYLLSENERQHFFQEVLPWMRRVTCNAPQLFNGKHVPVLRQDENRAVGFTFEEAVTLQCCCFFSIMPGRSYSSAVSSRNSKRASIKAALGISPHLPPCNFDHLFNCTNATPERTEAHLSKIRCVLQFFFNAFERAATPMQPTLEFSKVAYDHFPVFKNSDLPMQPVVFFGDGAVIEGDAGALQADFANRIIGGGVLGHGCVQEEIRLVISPELLLARVVCEDLTDRDVLFMCGAAQMSRYTGYADTFRFAGAADLRERQVVGPLRDARSGTPLPMRDVCVVAMDALNMYGQRTSQYASQLIDRETNKAFLSFYGLPAKHAALPSVHSGPIATGNWGSGAFGGDAELKLLIQWCAASEAARVLHYYTFERADLAPRFTPLQQKVARESWTVGDVYSTMLLYDAYLRQVSVENPSGPTLSVLEFVTHAPLGTVRSLRMKQR